MSLFSLFLSLLIVKAPWEKNLSLEALVAGIARYFLANIAKTGYIVLLTP